MLNLHMYWTSWNLKIENKKISLDNFFWLIYSQIKQVTLAQAMAWQSIWINRTKIRKKQAKCCLGYFAYYFLILVYPGWSWLIVVDIGWYWMVLIDCGLNQLIITIQVWTITQIHIMDHFGNCTYIKPLKSAKTTKTA